MPLTLCLHASFATPRVFLLRNGAVVAEDADGDAPADPSKGPMLAETTRAVLAAAGASLGDLDRVMIDVGPGRLSAVRAAVSFANALAFSLDRPLIPVLSSAGLGQQAERAAGRPAIVIHKSAGSTAYVARYWRALECLRHGPLAATLTEVAGDLDAFALVGLPKDVAADMLPDADIASMGDGRIAAETFARLDASITADQTVAGPVQPITEQSEIVDAR